MHHEKPSRIFCTRTGKLSRRAFIKGIGAAAAGALLVPSSEAFAREWSRERRLDFHNTHTDEELSIVCCPGEHYDRKVLRNFNYFMRDHRTDEEYLMDPALLDLLYAVSVLTGSRGTYQVMSGYRSPETNHMLRKISHRVAEHSLHTRGKAIDLRLSDVHIRDIRDVALALRQGGVGFYRGANFVHLDTGEVRSW